MTISFLLRFTRWKYPGIAHPGSKQLVIMSQHSILAPLRAKLWWNVWFYLLWSMFAGVHLFPVLQSQPAPLLWNIWQLQPDDSRVIFHNLALATNKSPRKAEKELNLSPHLSYTISHCPLFGQFAIPWISEYNHDIMGKIIDCVISIVDDQKYL